MRKLLLSGTLLVAALGLACVWGFELFAQDPQQPNYAGQLPRIPPKSPDDSLAEFEIVDGFEVQLVAAEPLVVDPVAIDFDASGRAYVVCMRDYSEQTAEQLGEIRLLTDTDADGRFDRLITFATELSWPTAIACYDGGVFVGAAPEILYLKDTDGDGQADVRRVVFRGFARDNVQGLLNSFRWGLDNRIHAAVSVSGAEIHKAGEPDETPAVILRGRDFSFDPRTLEIEMESGGGQHGMSFDDWGRKYVTSNSNHVQQVVIDDRYLRRNPLLPPTNPTAMIAADGPQAEVFRISPVEPWRVLRTQLRVSGQVPGPIEGGGRAAGYFTGATGVTLYRGDVWPVAERGRAFIGDVGSNIVHRKRLSAPGVQRLAERIDAGREFLASREIWFRPVQFANAPDGTLWALDMYREVIEHPKSLPPQIKQHLDLTSGRDRGRIYRIAPRGFHAPRIPDLAALNAVELVSQLSLPNAWRRETAARLLFERQDASAISQLQALAANDAQPLGQLHALWVLHGVSRLTLDDVVAALRSREPQLRRQAVRLAEDFLRDAQQTELQERAIKAIAPLANDDDVEVRYQVALSVGELPQAEKRLGPLLAIVRRDVQDPWVRLAVLTSVQGIAGEAFSEIAADEALATSLPGRELLLALADQAAADPEQLPAVLRWLISAWDLRPDEVTDAVLHLAPRLGRTPDEVRKTLRASDVGRALYETLRNAALDDSQAISRAVDASVRSAKLLWLFPWDEAQPAVARLLAPQLPPVVRAAAIGSLARIPDAAASGVLVEQWSALTPELRKKAEAALFARAAGVDALLDAIAAEQIATADVSQELISRLKVHPNAAVRERGARLFAQSTNNARAEVIAAYQEALQTPGDAAAGRKVFVDNCAKCHRRGDVGNEIGPSLADTAAKSREQLLTAVLDPNREVNPAFVNYVAETEDGRVLTGIIAAESAAGITLRREGNAEETIRRDNLVTLTSTGKSIMPEGLEREISVRQLADLLEFLTMPQ